MEDLPLACLFCAAAIPFVECGRQREYCSRHCSQSHSAQQRRWATYVVPDAPGRCPTCLREVPASAPSKRGRPRVYCSVRCQERRPGQHKKKPTPVPPLVPCDRCGTEFPRRNRNYRFCSSFCSEVFRGARLAEPIPSRICALPECDVEFRPKRDAQRCCGEEHSKKLWHVEHPGAGYTWNDQRRDAYHRRRAQKAGTSSSDRRVALAEIAARDKNRCHLCRKRVSVKPWPHPLSASLDHVIPLSQGGHHSPENVRLAHLSCNVAKGNGGGNEQLMLIG